MSIVERAVDLFGAAAKATRRPTEDGSELHPARIIERATALAEEPFRSAPEAKDVGQGPAVFGSHVQPRNVSIPREVLRRQRIMSPDDGRTAITESFRRVKRHVLANVNAPGTGHVTHLVMVTSALPGEGKTFCATNLAISLSMEMDRAVLLVDADVANPSVTSVLGIRTEGEKGLMDVLRDPALPLAQVVCETDIENLSVLPAGTRQSRASEMLASKAMNALLREICERYPERVVVFDSPPLLAASEACSLAGRMGQIVLVVEAGRTPESAVKDALSRIPSSNVVGALLNKGPAPGAGLGGYGYGYGYGN